ncbi:MAG: epimerase [Rhodospirillales bacterium]|nr:epimerase [Rhodospirillales bacterium]
MGATVALTGATGFVGGAIARHLSAKGYRLRLLARRTAALPALAEGATAISGGLGDPEALARLVEGAEMVVHAAGAIKAIDAQEFARVNRDGAAAVAQAALQEGVRRFVLISSIAARSPLLSAYAASKRAGETEVLDRLGDSLTILRPPVVYGPGDRETLPMFRAARFGFFPIPGPPEARLSFIHVADFAAAVGACLAAPTLPQGVFELYDGTPGGYGWRDIAAALGSAVGRTPRQIPIAPLPLRLLASAALASARLSGKATLLRPDKVNELRHPDWVCRDSRLGEITQWRAHYALVEGFVDAVAWYRAHGWLK